VRLAGRGEGRGETGKSSVSFSIFRGEEGKETPPLPPLQRGVGGRGGESSAPLLKKRKRGERGSERSACRNDKKEKGRDREFLRLDLNTTDFPK